MGVRSLVSDGVGSGVPVATLGTSVAGVPVVGITASGIVLVGSVTSGDGDSARCDGRTDVGTVVWGYRAGGRG